MFKINDVVNFTIVGKIIVLKIMCVRSNYPKWHRVSEHVQYNDKFFVFEYLNMNTKYVFTKLLTDWLCEACNKKCTRNCAIAIIAIYFVLASCNNYNIKLNWRFVIIFITPIIITAYQQKLKKKKGGAKVLSPLRERGDCKLGNVLWI